MGEFVFCYGSQNKKCLSKYIKQTKNSYKLYLSDNNYIYFDKIKTQDCQKYIEVDFNNSFEFLKFIVKKKIYCDMHNRNCKSFCFHNNYFKYIVENKHYDIIKFFCKKFIPLIKSNRNIYSFPYSLPMYVDLDDFNYIFKHSCLEDIYPSIIRILRYNGDVTIEFMDDIISIYKNKLTKLFINGNILDLDRKFEIDPQIFLIPSLVKDDVNLFDFIIEEICNLTSEIDKTKLDKKQLKLLENFKVKFDSEFICEIIYSRMLHDFEDILQVEDTYFCPKIFKQMLPNISDLINSLTHNRIIQFIIAYNIVEYMGILCDFIGDTEPKFINNMLIKATSTEMGQLLVDYGADYEKLYISTSFKNCSDCVKKLVKKIIKETSDS
ncbi:hypothetical protein [Acanthamoeba polyphaga mimivirus]|uniref:Uncharacterized protein n=1 Tax=Acanthamoeba polyphaga mimivirus TaxID=212035 RepID=A0A0G2Y591_MIMIV|nr:hypothetical protein [Acanthamoeba castellanii mamavirus]AHA45695.1 hypothetical protein HIRU_S789 [Hirudovirus strain Sangsue]AKI78937.1 hypothetical protein [Acanthamoeba polyphaga mimivirus]UMZ08315.1 hypothetical protein [Acanthamoeba polyphaga mimivirus]